MCAVRRGLTNNVDLVYSVAHLVLLKFAQTYDWGSNS